MVALYWVLSVHLLVDHVICRLLKKEAIHKNACCVCLSIHYSHYSFSAKDRLQLPYVAFNL